MLKGYFMKRLFVLLMAAAGFVFLSEPKAMAGVHIGIGLPFPAPVYYGPSYYWGWYPGYAYYPWYGYYGGYYGPYWRHRYYGGYYGRRYYYGPRYRGHWHY
jgi:hypothetical protein